MKMTNQTACPFCALDDSKVILSNNYVIAIHDGYPVTPGHSLIVPKRHIASFFEATKEEQEAMLSLLSEMRQRLLNPPQSSIDKVGNMSVPDGFNIGINDGASAGQTVMHLHIHLIPRYVGDAEDPRGGVRWIMPEEAPYWKNND